MRDAAGERNDEWEEGVVDGFDEAGRPLVRKAGWDKAFTWARVRSLNGAAGGGASRGAAPSLPAAGGGPSLREAATPGAGAAAARAASAKRSRLALEAGEEGGGVVSPPLYAARSAKQPRR